MLVIMGFDIPRKSGLEVLAWMRKRAEFQEIPAVMLSTPSLFTGTEVQKARRLGITAHLTKGLDFKELQHIYKIAVDHWNLLAGRSGRHGEKLGMESWFRSSWNRVIEEMAGYADGF